MRLLTKTERYALRDAVRQEMDRRHLSNKQLAALAGLNELQAFAATMPNGKATGRLVEIARALGIQTDRSAV
jgi:hypothetical protein